MSRVGVVVVAVLTVVSAVGGGTVVGQPAGVGAIPATQAAQAGDAPLVSNATTAEFHVDRPVLNGIHRPQLDGRLYGHANRRPAEGRTAEWTDGYNRSVVLVSSDQRQFEGRLFVKSVDGGLYVGLSTGPLGVDRLRSAILDLDRDGDGERSTGDARLVFDFGGLRTTKEIDKASPLLYEYRNGEYVRPDVAPAPFGALALHRGDGETGPTLEARVDTRLLDEVLGDAGTGEEGERTGIDLELRGGDRRFVLERFDDRYHQSGLTLDRDVLIPELDLPKVDLGVDHLEVTQAVQTANNDLRLVREKETLARAFVTHDRSSALDVRVTFEAWDVSGGARSYLGSRSVTFAAPPGTPDRTRIDDSANLELPAAWVDVGELELRASASAPLTVDTSAGNDADTVRKLLFETHDLAIYRVRVNVGSASSPQQASVARMDLISSALADSFPVAQPRFRTLGWETIGVQSASDRDGMIADLDAAGDRLRAAWLLSLLLTGTEPSAPLPDQVYGVTPQTVRGISDPRWWKSTSDSLAALGSGFKPTMAHEVNHNLGNDTWGRHVAGTGYGCGAGGPDSRWDSLYSDDDIHALGWEPGNGLIDATRPDVMSYCTSGRWMSDYRWELLLDRLRGFQASQPVHPDLLSLETAALEPSGKTVLGREVPTVRVITGALYPDGSATLDPSFEQPGVVEDTERRSEKTGARLRITREDGSVERLPLAAEFVDVEGGKLSRDRFSVIVRDNGTIRQIEIVDAQTGEALAGRESSGFEFDGARFGVPEAFERGDLVRVGAEVAASTERLHKQVLYSPDPESGLWYPYGRSFTGDAFNATFTGLPGGEEARFLLLVSDGVRTRFATSPTFSVPALPPSVIIERNDRWIAEGEDGSYDEPPQTKAQNVAGPVETAVGAPVSLLARGYTGSGAPLGGEKASGRIEWTALDANESVVASDAGKRFDHSFDRPGTYLVRATAVDTDTELTASDAIEVRVGLPPLPYEEDVRALRTAVAAATGDGGGGSGPRLALRPTPQSTVAGATATYDLVFDPATDGVGTYDLNVTVDDTSVATLAQVHPRLGPDPTAPGTFNITTRAADNSTVRVQQVGVAGGTGNVTLASVTVRGVAPGNASLSLSNVVIGDRNDSAYALADVSGATLTVRAAPAAPDVNGNGLPATDPDGDGLYEDVNGDGTFNIIDVSVFLGAFDDPVVQDDLALFDFDGDGTVNILDVATLLDEV